MGGRVREEVEREKRVNQIQTAFVQLHKTRTAVPRQRNGMRLQDCMPPTSSHCGCGASEYISARRKEDRRPDSYT